MKRFTKSEIKRFEWAIKYIRSELLTGRHILACLGSAGLTFNDDIERFEDYALQFGGKDVVEKIKEYSRRELNFK